jgi:glycosyltransferase involved in cell wall biosynthesis
LAPKVLFIGNYNIPEHNIRPEAEMIIGLADQGLTVEVMTQADCWYAQRMESRGVTVHDFVPRSKFSLQAIRTIRRVLKTGRHDVVQMFNNKAIVNGLIASTGLPVKAVTYRGQTGNISRFDPVCYLTHLSPRVDAIVCVSEAVRSSLAREVRDPSRLVTIYKGHDIAWYASVRPADRVTLGLPVDAFVIGCVASNRPRKGIPVLLRATHEIDPSARAHLLLVGGNMDTPEIRDTIAASPMADRIHLLGHRDDVLPIVAACDATVLPALKREGLPKTVIESMALGVPAIATSTGGSPELIVSGESGLIVPPGDPGAIADAINRLASDRSYAQRIGAAGHARIRDHFRLQDAIAQHRRLFERLIS